MYTQLEIRMTQELYVEVDWDLEGADGPPKIVSVPLRIWAAALGDPEDSAPISDWLSDEHGFTHFGWTITEQPGDFTEEQRKHLVDQARAHYALNSNNDIEIDDNARAILAGDDGAWVQAWLFLRLDGLPED